jgi:hypothetical protein
MEPSACLLPQGFCRPDLPGALAAVLGRLHAAEMSCAAVAQQIADAWDVPAPFRRALEALGHEADRSGIDNAYHNPAHTRDVAVIWANLARLHEALARSDDSLVPLRPQDVAAGICAALGHDLLHDGVGNVVGGTRSEDPLQRVAFRLERIAASRVRAVLGAAGLEPAMAAGITAAILVTDPVEGFAALKAAGDVAPMGEFAPLADATWQLMAQMLRDADLLTSIGLTATEYDRQSALLAQEIGEDLNTAESAAQLFDRAAVERFASPAGGLFRAQFSALRAINAVRSARGETLAAAAHRVAGP